MNGPNYVSESIWTADTFLTLLTLLFMFVAMCIPAIIAHRNNDKKQMRVGLVCALTGMFLLIPWIVSVVQVSKKYKMTKKKDGAVTPGLYTLCSLVLIGIGGAILYRNYFKWGSTGGISLILYGAVLLAASLLSGKSYWVGQMVAAPLLVSCMRLEYTETLYRIYEVVAIVGALLMIYNAVKSTFPAGVTQQAVEAARSKWAEQTVLGVTEKAAQFRNIREADSEKTPKANQGGSEKMKLERCPNGHFYDSAKHGDICPYCAALQQTDAAPKPAAPVKTEEQAVVPASAPVIAANQATAPVEAVPQSPKQPSPQTEQPAKIVQEVSKQPVKKQKTATPTERKRNQPVVGWLVCIKGVYRGESFTLKAGRNFIGRNADMDVCLQEDNSIAGDKQAAIIYEPRSRQFILMPGDVHELCYINNEVTLSSTSLKAYDVLDIGDTSLLLIPCCGEKFSWEDGIAK